MADDIVRHPAHGIADMADGIADGIAGMADGIADGIADMADGIARCRGG